MTKLLLPGLLAAGLLARPALAQEPAAAYPRTETVYYAASHRKLPTEAGAEQRLEITQLDSVQSQERVFYPSGKLRTFHCYLTGRRNGHRHSVSIGRDLGYYESGQLHVQTDLPTLQRTGERLVYYPDGKLRRRDLLPAQGPATGECFGPDGQPVPYCPYQQMPV